MCTRNGSHQYKRKLGSSTRSSSREDRIRVLFAVVYLGDPPPKKAKKKGTYLGDLVEELPSFAGHALDLET